MNGFERRRERKKDAIKQAALDLFRLYGFEKVSIYEIARKAGVSHVTIYNNFGSKEELVREVVKSLLLGLVERYGAIVRGDRAFPEKLEAIVLDKYEIASQYQGELLQSAARSDPVIQQLIESLWQKEINQLTVSFVEEGKKAGYINRQLSHEAILAYLEILRRGIGVSADSLVNRTNGQDLACDLVSLIHYGLFGKAERSQ